MRIRRIGLDWARQYPESFVRLFFPNICLACGTDLYAGEEFICLHCRRSLVPTDHVDFPDNPVYGLLRPHVPVSRVAAMYSYGQSLIIQRLLHDVKYGGNHRLGRYIGGILGDYLARSAAWRDMDLLLPLPLHPGKLAKRGFNQSEVICTGMAGVLDLDVCNGALVRFRRTATQTKQGRIGRWENVEGTFGVRDAELLTHKKVLLVDDVITTGATLAAAVDALKDIEGIEVSVAAVACSGEL